MCSGSTYLSTEMHIEVNSIRDVHWGDEVVAISEDLITYRGYVEDISTVAEVLWISEYPFGIRKILEIWLHKICIVKLG